jgi:hypothetical protein
MSQTLAADEIDIPPEINNDEICDDYGAVYVRKDKQKKASPKYSEGNNSNKLIDEYLPLIADRKREREGSVRSATLRNLKSGDRSMSLGGDRDNQRSSMRRQNLTNVSAIRDSLLDKTEQRRRVIIKESRNENVLPRANESSGSKNRYKPQNEEEDDMINYSSKGFNKVEDSPDLCKSTSMKDGL